MLREQQTLLNAKLNELRMKHTQVDVLDRLTWQAQVNVAQQLKWQARASQEMTARLHAESQQRQIRLKIERRAAVIQTLQEIFDMQQSTNVSTAPCKWSADDIKLYDTFQSQLAASYSQTGAVLQECGLAVEKPAHTDFYSPVARRDVVRNIYFESTSAFSIPSKYPATANVMFDAMRQTHRRSPQRNLDKMDEYRPDTIAVKFETYHHWEEGKVVSQSFILVMRRFVESDRTVFVWRSLIEGEFAGTYLDETGWTVLQPTSSDSTDVRTCMRSVPMHGGRQAVSTTASDAFFAKAVVRSSEPSSLQLAQLMGQLLLDSK
ncbi:unnamed protein product [Phytophthora fragariaefolia]|uniref:Unnamed protein product n=1 Tax=Phytophthora fragariaefolia TaxID=1490495 RepID=A0A9W7DDR3_9STRA|nr:unnamed protein product [Phytophthora fragariaefolia]